MPLELLCLLPCEPEHTLLDGEGPGALRDNLIRDLDLINHAKLSGLISLLWERYRLAPSGFNMVMDDPDQAKRRALRIRRGDWERAQELCDDYFAAVYPGKRREF